MNENSLAKRVEKRREEAKAKYEALQGDAEYFAQSFDELLRDHPEHWIAIVQRSVVSLSPSLKSLLDQLHAQGIPASQVLIDHLTDTDSIPLVAYW